ncbi:helix-turn-helix transcriptional regulator [Acetobacter ascendens]|nr:AlpA family phage regulatory protein [Acetobacter ascendens]
MSPSYVRLLIRNDKFPPATHKISPRTVRWLESTVTEWIQLNAKNNN